MKLSTKSDCPLGRDLQPGCERCQECSFFVSKEWNDAYEVECVLANIREKMFWRIHKHSLSENLWDFTDDLLDIVIEEDVLKEKSGDDV